MITTFLLRLKCFDRIIIVGIHGGFCIDYVDYVRCVSLLRYLLTSDSAGSSGRSVSTARMWVILETPFTSPVSGKRRR